MDAILVHDISHLNAALQKLNHRIHHLLKERVQNYMKSWIDTFTSTSSTSDLVPFMSLELTIERDQMTLTPSLFAVRDVWSHSLHQCFAIALDHPLLKDPRFHMPNATADTTRTFVSMFDVSFCFLISVQSIISSHVANFRSTLQWVKCLIRRTS